MKYSYQPQLSSAAHSYMQKVERRVDRIKALSSKQRKKQTITNLFFLGLGMVFALSVLYVIYQNGNFSGNADFSASFTRLLHR